MEKEEYKKSVLEYEDVQRAVQYAREQGEKFGYSSGIEQGIEQGIELGRRERDRQIAFNLLAVGFDVATIAKVTGLSEAEIKEMAG